MRKDYELIARVLRETLAVNDQARRQLAAELADALDSHEPHFDRRQFIRACMDLPALEPVEEEEESEGVAA